MLIARVIADRAALSASLGRMLDALGQIGLPARHCVHASCTDEIVADGAGAADWPRFRAVLEHHLPPADVLIADQVPLLPGLFVSDMDSTMIGQECIDELADFAGLKPQISAITERAMRGELDFEAALRERVLLLRGLSDSSIQDCLAARIKPMAGAKTLVATLKALGCRTVLVTGGFHQFADPVAELLGFDRVVGNRLEVIGGTLTGGLVGDITDSSVKRRVLLEEAALIGPGTISLATGDGANDIPMIAAATYGVAYHAKPKARAAANCWIDCGDLTDVLRLLGIPESEWTVH